MERDLSQSSVCRSGCGFYGNPATDGLCSKCYKLAVMRKQAVPPSSTNSSAVGQSSSCPSPSSLPKKTSTPLIEADLAIATPTVPSSSAQSSFNPEASSSQRDSSAEVIKSSTEDLGKLAAPEVKKDIGEASSSSQPLQTGAVKAKAKNRCHTCKVKIGVVGFPCRCGGNFCAAHRYANEHNCSFDYKTHGQNEIRENNPKVLGEKIQKI